MNKLIKLAVSAAIVAPFLLGAVASAATISNPLFSNGQTTIDANGGATVNGTFTLTVGTGEVVEWLRATPDTYPFTDTSVGGTLGYQEGVYTNVPFSVKVPPNTGTYNITEQGAGIYGGNRSINGGDNVNTGPTNVGTVRVVANAESSTSVGTDNSVLAQILAALNALLHPATPPAPTTSAVCTAYAQANVGTQLGVYNSANIRLQGFLLSQGASIPALAAGASFGFYGNQTAAAVAWFQGLNHCQ